MILEETYTLSNGVEIPKLGLGTWMIDDGKVAGAVNAAVELGYRHIDTAQAYGNERGVGEAVRDCGVARDELFVTTKLDAGIKDYDGAKAAIDGSLKTLGLDRDRPDDHPQPAALARISVATDRYFEGNLDAWRALEEAYNAGKLRAIGVSNFQKERPGQPARQGLGQADGQPDPRACQQHAVRADRLHARARACWSKPIRRSAHGKILGNGETSARWRRNTASSVPQLCIRYCLQLGPAAAAEDREPGAHAQQRRGGFRDLRRGHGDARSRPNRIKDYGDASVFPVYGGKR